MSSSKIIGQSSASKRCVVISGCPRLVCLARRRHQMSLRQQFWLTCDAAVHKAFFEAKQRYGAPRLAGTNCRSSILKPLPPACVVRLRAKVQPGQLPCTWPARIGESAGAGTSAPEARNQKWAGDITYLRTDEGWLYRSSHRPVVTPVIGWSMSPRMTAITGL